MESPGRTEGAPVGAVQVRWHQVPYVFALGLRASLRELSAPGHREVLRQVRLETYRNRHRLIRVPGVFILALIVLVAFVDEILAPALSSLRLSAAQLRWSAAALASLSVSLLLGRLLNQVWGVAASIYGRGLQEFALRQNVSRPR